MSGSGPGTSGSGGTGSSGSGGTGSSGSGGTGSSGSGGSGTTSNDYPKFAFIFPVVLLLITFGINQFLPSFLPGYGPYASGYVSEFGYGAAIIAVGLGLERFFRGTSAKDLVYYLAPLVSALGAFAVSFIFGILTSFTKLPVGGTYTGGEGFMTLLVLTFGNDIAHYVFRKTTHERF